MDREGAETYLRLLAEAAMRGSLAPAAEPRPPDTSRLLVVGHALTAVGALDPLVADRARRARTRFVGQAIQALVQEPRLIHHTSGAEH